MRILVVSDLHLDFHDDGGREFLQRLDPHAADVLVVAGDLCPIDMLYSSVRALCACFKHVVYVAGNHEYYGSDRDEVHRLLAAIAADLPGFHWLHETEVVIDGVRFGGTTLWFPNDPENEHFAHLLNDFSQIRGFRRWVYQDNARAVQFLEARAPSLDVVVTHHVPAGGSTDPRFAGSPLNRFFLCDVEHVIARGQPSLWVHGHTHASCDWRLGRTRILCNPAGYHAENVDFNARLVVEVEARQVDHPPVVTCAPEPPMPVQDEAVSKVRAFYRGLPIRRGVLLLSPSDGRMETVVRYLTEDWLSENKVVIWIADRQELLEHAAEAFKEHVPLLRNGVSLHLSRFDRKQTDLSGNVILVLTDEVVRDGARKLSVQSIRKLNQTGATSGIICLDQIRLDELGGSVPDNAYLILNHRFLRRGYRGLWLMGCGPSNRPAS